MKESQFSDLRQNIQTQQSETSKAKLELNTALENIENLKKREDKLDLIQFKLEQLEELPIGSEIIEGEVHSIQSVAVGDDWHDILQDQSIIIKDGIVVKIEQE